MKIRRIPKTETLGYCHDCHNRARSRSLSRTGLQFAYATVAAAS